MRIQRIFNNNVIIAINAQGKECVVIGKGIAYGHKVLDPVDEVLIEKVFSPRKKGVADKLSQIIEQIPLGHIKVCDEIINMIQKQLNKKLNDSIYLALIDHLSFAIKRYNKSLDILYSLKWEMKRYYAKEFKIGLLALDIIEKRLGLRLPEDEAAFITLYILSASSPDGQVAEEILMIVRAIMEIVDRWFGTRYDGKSHAYERFMRHVKNFARSVVYKNNEASESDSKLDVLLNLQKQYSQEVACVQEIVAYIEKEYNYLVASDERAFLFMHVRCIINPKED